MLLQLLFLEGSLLSNCFQLFLLLGNLLFHSAQLRSYLLFFLLAFKQILLELISHRLNVSHFAANLLVIFFKSLLNRLVFAFEFCYVRVVGGGRLLKVSLHHILLLVKQFCFFRFIQSRARLLLEFFQLF